MRSPWTIAAALLVGLSAFSPSLAQVTTTYTYDARGRVKTVTRPANAVTYTYDAADNRTNLAVSYPFAPIAGAASLAAPYNTAGSVVLPVSGSYTSLAVASAPAHGAASISGVTATYTPTSGYSGPDSFTYTATGGGGTSGAATVSVTVASPAVNHAPTASNDSTTLPAGEGVEVNVTANDSDPDGDVLTVTGVSPASTIRASYFAHDGSISVQAKAKTGTDTVTYTISDGRGGTASATLQVSVGPPQ